MQIFDPLKRVAVIKYLNLTVTLLLRHHHAACWLVLIGYLLDFADGAVARRLDACSALGKWSVVVKSSDQR